MPTRHFAVSLHGPILVIAMSVLSPAPLLAHCDGLDGPVVTAAQAALETRNAAAVLVWVHADDEPEIQRAFEQTLAVRSLSPEAKALADRFFFETVVRLHRAGEGAPYTGLKPAGRDLGPAIPAADAALAARSLEPLAKLMTDTAQDGLRAHFDRVVAAAEYDVDDVAAGRDYVRAYVEFVHYVERLHEAAATGAPGHFDDTPTHQIRDGR